MKSFFTAAANKVRTFAPSASPSKTTLPPEQRLKRNWEYLHTAFYRDLQRQDVAVHDTEWPKRLEEIRNLLLQEERNGREVRLGRAGERAH